MPAMRASTPWASTMKWARGLDDMAVQPKSERDSLTSSLGHMIVQEGALV
jgi:hypothetical protein